MNSYDCDAYDSGYCYRLGRPLTDKEDDICECYCVIELNMSNQREHCPMRHANGNCLPCGGFCTAVSNEMCKALHNAYDSGYTDCNLSDLWDMPSMGGYHDD